METKTTFTDKATTILGILVILWVMAVYTYAMFNTEISFDWKEVTGFAGLAVFLIIFKGESARDLFTKIVNKIIPKRDAKSATD